MSVLSKALQILTLVVVFSGLQACSVTQDETISDQGMTTSSLSGETNSLDGMLVDDQVNDGKGSSSNITTDVATNMPFTDVESKTIDGISVPSGSVQDQIDEEIVAKNVSPALPEASFGTVVGAEGGVGVTIQSISLEQKKSSAGYVVLSVSGSPSYKLRQTAPTEYTLVLKNSTVDPTAAMPQLLPRGTTPGIRSVRTTQSGADATVRMFVDSGVSLMAQETSATNGATITVRPQPSTTASTSFTEEVVPTSYGADVRAQLQPEAAKPPAEDDKSKVEVKENESTARENPTGLISSDGSKVYTGRLISLDLQDTDIDNALRIIAEVSNLNIIASDDVTGKVTLRLIDVPWDQALDVILKTNGLDQVTEGNVIRIAPIDKLRQEREALKEAKKAQEMLEDLSVRYIRVSYARAVELKEQVESVLSERGTVSVDERTNQLIIKDTKKGQTQTADLLRRLDLRTPQVLLETQIVESGRNILRDLGFQWSFAENHSPATGNATGLNFPNTFNLFGSNVGPGSTEISSFGAISPSPTEGFGITALLDSADGARTIGARLSALERERRVRVVSRPQVATVNNKQAEISSVETLRVRLPSAGTAISTGAGAQAASGAQTAFEEIKVGIELKVTPQASPDYFVLLDINAKSSTLGNRVVDNIPSTVDRTANSTVLIKSGQTFALGGVYRLNDQDSVTGIPFIKDIPFLGQFFRRTFFDKSDEELIFFITPHIVEGSFDPSAM